MILNLLVYLDFGVIVCPGTSVSDGYKKVIGFMFAQLFFHCGDGNDNLQGLHLVAIKPEAPKTFFLKHKDYFQACKSMNNISGIVNNWSTEKK